MSDIQEAQVILKTAVSLLQQHDKIVDDLAERRAFFEMIRAGFGDQTKNVPTADMYNLSTAEAQNKLDKFRDRILSSLPERVSWEDYRKMVARAQFQWRYLSEVQVSLFSTENTPEDAPSPEDVWEVDRWSKEYDTQLEKFYEVTAKLKLADPTNIITLK